MQFVTVSKHFNQTDADLVAAGLRAAGFDVLLHSEVSALTSGLSLFRIQVPEDRSDEARQFLAAEEEADRKESHS